MRRLADRFAEAAQECADLERLGALLEEAVDELGFDHFALLDHASLQARSARLVRIDNYPASWVEEMLREGYASYDPVHLACRRTGAGFGWGELARIIRLDRTHKKILSRSHYHGLGLGFTVPSNVPGEPSGSCSFAVRKGRDMPLARLHCAELIGLHALGAMRRLSTRSQMPVGPSLSRREVQCLRLVALGKSDWEIARILGLSPHTASQYVKRARAAYDTVSRAQLVAYGLRDAWIDFEDAIPQNRGMG